MCELVISVLKSYFEIEIKNVVERNKNSLIVYLGDGTKAKISVKNELKYKKHLRKFLNVFYQLISGSKCRLKILQTSS